MTHAQDAGPYARTDLRLLKVQIERAANVVRGTILASPCWGCFAVFATSALDPTLGSVPVARGLALIFAVILSSLAAHYVLKSYDADKETDIKAHARWLRQLFALNVFLSATWGLAPWLLWAGDHRVNHAFIELICLAVVARFLVNRANHLWFFLGSFLPMAVMLFGRLIIGFDPVDMVFAAVVPLYAVQVVLDSSHISQRWDQEASTRFSHEDISRELEEARDEALMKRAEAEAANASKTSFLANMSHELRTPLNAILGFSDIIAREYLGPIGSPRYKEYAGDIHNSGTHLLSLINDLLDVAKIEAGRLEIEPHMIETKRALDGALKFVGPKARERNQAIAVTVEDDAAVLYADERALKQIMINLVSNSIKFSPEGGHIEVAARRDHNGDFELIVTDNGRGIPKAKLDRIFKPFSRVDNRYDSETSGTGLGLALVRGLAELHGGRAWLESEYGKGCRAYVVLPAEPPKQVEQAA